MFFSIISALLPFVLDSGAEPAGISRMAGGEDQHVVFMIIMEMKQDQRPLGAISSLVASVSSLAQIESALLSLT